MLVGFEQRGRLREKAEVIFFALCCHRHHCEHPGVDTAPQELCAHEQGTHPPGMRSIILILPQRAFSCSV